MIIQITSINIKVLAENTLSSQSVPTIEDVYILEEDVSKRREFEKHYLCSNGTYLAVSYNDPIHWKNEETGTWEDVDITFGLNQINNKYEMINDKFGVSLSKTYNDNKVISITNDQKYTISWKTTAKNNGVSPTYAEKDCNHIAVETFFEKESHITIKKDEPTDTSIEKGCVNNSKALFLSNRKATIEYDNAFGNVRNTNGITLRYSISQYRVEEDVILSDKSMISDYVMTLDIGELIAVKQHDGSVVLQNVLGEMQFKIGVPFMYDSEYNTNYNIRVSVEQSGSECVIIYTTDKDWLTENDRTYPVIFDPAITTGEYSNNLVDTYITGLDTHNHSNEPNITVGVKNNEIHRAYIKISTLPVLPNETIPISANLSIKHGANTTTGKVMQIHRVLSAWEASTITFADEPSSSSTAITSCPFNTSNVSFDFPQAEIQGLYNRIAEGTNYGYMIRYTDESNASPDFNVLRSMEYPTASERPVLSVFYSYALPSELSVNTVYSFKNVNSGKYLSVSGGIDANDTNVVQYDGDNSVSQQFILEASSTGNGYILRSIVGTQTKVLDIYKTGGYVENDCNVQIYDNVDPIAQEWLIIPMNSYYRIVPRSNPQLALTSYGTANGTAVGKSSTSLGNVFVSTYNCSNSQLWIIETSNGATIDPVEQKITNGEYYLNSRSEAKYLRSVSGELKGASGTLSELGASSVRWKFTYISGKYIIQPVNNINLYLSYSLSANNVSLVNVSGDIPATCLWTVVTSDDYSSIALKDSYNRFLWINGTTLQMSNTENSAYDWRYVSSSNMKELSAFSVNDIVFDGGGTKVVSVNSKTPNVASFSSYSDFEYSVASTTALSEWVQITRSTAGVSRIVADGVGCAEIQATHRITKKTCTFTVYSDRYMYELINSFGFTNDAALLIRDLYNRVDDAYSTHTEKQKAWVASRVLSEAIYDGTTNEIDFIITKIGINKWDDVAGTVTSEDNRETYFVNTLGYSASEYNLLNNELCEQHDNKDTPDFAHMQYALAARLAYSLNEDGWLSNIYTQDDDEYVSYLAGWLGDAVLCTDDRTTSFCGDDYTADLDAESIFREIESGEDSITVINEYYDGLSSGNNRASIFLTYIDYTTVKTMVYSELVEENMLNDEDYCIEKIMQNYPDTYNFLMSLQNNLSFMYSYIN